MKKMCMFAAAAAMIFTSCSKENDGPIQVIGSNTDLAYVSIKIATAPESRATSGEDKGTDAESTVKSLYLITFNSNNGVEAIPGGGYYKAITNPTAPDVEKISAKSTSLLVIANPGAGLLNALDELNPLSSYSTFNTAITKATIGDIVGDTNTGFAMIASGDETGKSAGQQILTPLVPISDKLVTVTDPAQEEAAKAEARTKKVTVVLERLAAKLMVNKSSSIELVNNAQFELLKWTVDAVNGSYYPFAEKTLMSGHTQSSDPAIEYHYNNAFYTKDPNYTNNAGIVYGDINDKFEQVLPAPYNQWRTPGTDHAYVIENTMEGAFQTIENATRIVLQATYTPEGYPAGKDWFSFEGKTFKGLDSLKVAYGKDDAPTALKDACVHFYGRIKNYYDTVLKTTLGATKFEDLTQVQIDAVTVGGEAIKEGKKSVIFWYNDAVCYYYYEIRHDNDLSLGDMVQNKYGVVRNNWYNLRLDKVNRPGTPWYPDIDNPGPGDPDPKDPIDKAAGYIAITIQRAPWFIKEIGFEI